MYASYKYITRYPRKYPSISYLCWCELHLQASIYKVFQISLVWGGGLVLNTHCLISITPTHTHTALPLTLDFCKCTARSSPHNLPVSSPRWYGIKRYLLVGEGGKCVCAYLGFERRGFLSLRIDDGENLLFPLHPLSHFNALVLTSSLVSFREKRERESTILAAREKLLSARSSSINEAGELLGSELSLFTCVCVCEEGEGWGCVCVSTSRSRTGRGKEKKT